MKKINLKNSKVYDWVKSIILIIFAAFTFSLAVKMFISPKGLLSSGVSGVTLIIGRLVDRAGGPSETQVAGVLYFIFNAPLLILSWKKLNKKFTILSGIHVIISSILVAVLPDTLTEIILDKKINEIGYLDAALFAGALAGGGTAIAFLAGGSGAGIDIISFYFSSKKQMSVGKINAIVNCAIILCSIILFRDDGSILLALYTMIYILTNAMCIDALYIRNRKTAIYIVTNKGDEVSKFIMSKFHRGVTVLDSKGAYTGNHKDFLYVVTTSFEAMTISKEVQKFDPDCFISINSLERIFGRFINKEMH